MTGEDYSLWHHSFSTACRAKGVWGVFEKSTSLESSRSSNMTDAERVRIDSGMMTKPEKVSGVIISGLGDAPFPVDMDVDDDPDCRLLL